MNSHADSTDQPEVFSDTVEIPAAPGVISLQAQLQKTKPSLPLKDALPDDELGDSGIRMLHGIITEEYNPQLQGRYGIRVFDEMRKNDGTVRAAILALTWPIRRASWFVNPASSDPEHIKHAEFIEHALFDWLDLTWDDVIRQALNMVPLGVMLFEKIYGTYEFEGKTYVTLKRLAPRMPKSILMWELTDGTFGVQQIRQDGVLAQIPGSKLLIFVNEREGDNWWGTSMLRSAYKHWYYKNNFYKIDAVSFERQGMGIPFVKLPPGAGPDEEEKAATSLKNLRANESAYMIIPNTYDTGFMDMGAKGVRDPQTSIDHHNKEILQSVLAQFLELGQATATHGSRALSQDHSDLFLKGLEAVANTIVDEFNKALVKELVDLNFNNVDVYPELDYSGIRKQDAQAVATAYAQLVTSGGITPTDDDEQYLRELTGLPARTQEEMSEEGEADTPTDITDAPPPENDDDPSASDGNKTVETQTTKAETAKNKKQSPEKQAHAHTPLPLKFDDGNGFMTWRKLTFAEKKVSFKNIQDKLDELQTDLTQRATEMLNEAKTKFLKKMQKAVEEKDSNAIRALRMNFIAAYSAMLAKYMQEAYVYGKNNASAEMGVQPPASSAQSLSNIRLIADAAARKAESDLESKAKVAAANVLNQNDPIFQAMGVIDETLSNSITKIVRDTAAIVVAQSLDAGRRDVFAANRDKIKVLQRSEVLDKKTCNFCLSMDGLVISPDDAWANSDIFHSNCRGMWVEVLTTEDNAPEITGVPDTIAKYYQGAPNMLTQPASPILREDSPAAAFVKKEKRVQRKTR